MTTSQPPLTAAAVAAMRREVQVALDGPSGLDDAERGRPDPGARGARLHGDRGAGIARRGPGGVGRGRPRAARCAGGKTWPGRRVDGRPRATGVTAPRTAPPRARQGRAAGAPPHLGGLARGSCHRVAGDRDGSRDRLPLPRGPAGRRRAAGRRPRCLRGDERAAGDRSRADRVCPSRRGGGHRSSAQGRVRASGLDPTRTRHDGVVEHPAARRRGRGRLRRPRPRGRQRPRAGRSAHEGPGDGRRAGRPGPRRRGGPRACGPAGPGRHRTFPGRRHHERAPRRKHRSNSTS